MFEFVGGIKVSGLIYAMKALIYFFILLLFVGCSSKHGDFETYLSQIKSVSTPVKFWTLGYTDNKMKSIPDERLFDKYKYCYANETFGKIYNGNKSVGIIYTVYGDMYVPVLVTYSNKGEKVDSISLFDNASGFNLEKETMVSVTLFPDKTIREINSTFTWTLNEAKDDRIPGSDKLSIDTITYLVSDDGKIEKRQSH